MSQNLLDVVLVGTAATALLDLWSVLRLRWLGTPLPDYALVGRWIGHMRRGRFRHDAISRAAPVTAERWIGWAAHYLIGIAFASLLPALGGPLWLQCPSLLLSLGIGVTTVAAPLLLMQPGMGAGLAARRTPNPTRARRQSLISHALFGVGLYAATHAVRLLLPS